MPTPKDGAIGIFLVFLMSAGVLGLPVSFWLPIGIMAVVAFWGDRIKLSAQLRLAILRKGIIRTFLMLPLPVGEGWGGGSNAQYAQSQSVHGRHREHSAGRRVCRADHQEDVAMCPRCGNFCTDIHEEDKRCVRHLDIWGKKTFLHFMSRRFDCEQCGKPFTEELPFVDSHRRQTRAFEYHVYELSLSSNKKAAARSLGLSQSDSTRHFQPLG